MLPVHHRVLRDGERAAVMYTLIATSKLNGVDSQAWLTDVLRRIADHPATRLYELLPWHWQWPAKEACSVSAFRPRWSGMIVLDQQAEITMIDLEVPVEGMALDALDTFLSDQSPPDSMMLSDLDGFLTAIAIGPEVIMPSEWLPVIWGMTSRSSPMKPRRRPSSAAF